MTAITPCTQLEELKESTKETSEKLDNAQVKLQKSETKLEQRKKFLANAVKVLEVKLKPSTRGAHFDAGAANHRRV